jgi:hypothetical protein
LQQKQGERGGRATRKSQQRAAQSLHGLYFIFRFIFLKRRGGRRIFFGEGEKKKTPAARKMLVEKIKKSKKEGERKEKKG